MILWLRHVRAPQAVASAFLATLIVALLVAALPMEEGTTLPIRSLWLAMTLSVPVLFLFTVEDDWDRLSVRPVRRRRAALVAVAALSAGVASAVFYPGNMWDSGAAAMLRNCLGLIGAGLLSLAFLPRWMIWVTPTVLGIASMAFSVPAEPGTAMTLWGALRMPGPVHTTGGALDLSWPLCLAVFVAGAAVYVAGVVVPGRLTVARVGGRRGPLPGTRPPSRPPPRRRRPQRRRGGTWPGAAPAPPPGDASPPVSAGPCSSPSSLRPSPSPCGGPRSSRWGTGVGASACSSRVTSP
ncbi:hypothetical protein [Corynebacterium bovis]|uniref:hypothetical protein n=1 Tax=Corynebacterium bovis TaxID=36808 RepID=UPI0031388816